jgi:hypothetical protein
MPWPGLSASRTAPTLRDSVVGKQAAGRVGFFLHADDFGAAYARMTSAGVQFVRAPRTEPYGRVAVFPGIAGNKWDLIGPEPVPRVVFPSTEDARGCRFSVILSDDLQLSWADAKSVEKTIMRRVKQPGFLRARAAPPACEDGAPGPREPG